MNIYPKELANVDSVYIDPMLSEQEGYWFSYTNDIGDILHVFREILLIAQSEYRNLPFTDIDNISLSVPDSSTPAGCGININLQNGEVVFFQIDTKHGSHFLDVFAIHRALSRQTLIANR